MHHTITEPPKLLDPAAVADALRLLIPAGDVFEVRALHATTGDDAWRPATWSGYFDGADAAVKQLGRLTAASGIYVVLNELNPALLARAANRLRKVDKGGTTTDGDVLRRRWLPVDLDAVRASGVSSTDAEHEAAIERAEAIFLFLDKKGFTNPILADSGNGAHLLYRIDLPADDGGLVKRCLEALAERFNDSAVKVDASVYNPARIWKLYGTLAAKGDSTADRPHRLAAILVRPDVVRAVPRELLEQLAGPATATAKPAGASPRNGEYHANGAPFDVEGFIRRHNLDATGPSAWTGAQGSGQRWEFDSSPMCEHGGDGPYLLQHASGAVSAGCHHESCGWNWPDLRARFEPKAERVFDGGDTWRAAPANGERAAQPAIGPEPILTCLADVDPRDVSWLWPGRIPAGRLTLLVGRPGEGKSFATIDMASRVSTGTPWPDGSECPQGSVILISAEDDPGDTIRPRLDAHYADVQRVHLLSAVRRIDKDGQIERMISLADVDAIEMALQRLPDCKLIVVDPVGSFLGGGTDAHRDNEVRSVLAPIAALAEKYGPAVLVVAHRRKSLASSADDTALGSRAFTGIARAVWHLSRDPDNKSRRLFLPGKNNLAREGDGLAFSIIGEPPRISWERDPVTMSADDGMAAECQGRKPGPEPEVSDAASEWLRTALADSARLAKELVDEWVNGQGGSKRTLERAKTKLGAQALRMEVPGPWWWRLPPNTAKSPQDRELGDLGGVVKNPGFLPFSDPGKPNTAKFSDLGGVGEMKVTDVPFGGGCHPTPPSLPKTENLAILAVL